MLTVGSLFAGIGGFDLGFERAGMHTSWFCENDPFCQQVLAKHWPDVPCYPDITKLTAGDVESVDVLCGGFPCQDISPAGKGAGINGSRSGLWGEFARLIGELRPSYVVVENVSALKTKGLGRVLGEMAALGYDTEWDCLPASTFGAPHQRDRVWIVAYPDDGRRDRRPRKISEENRRRQFAHSSQWAVEPDVGRVANGVPRRVDRLRSLGNALVPQIAQWIGERIVSLDVRDA